MTKYLKNLHFLSLDVVLGAIISSWMFWKMPDGNGEPDFPSLILLGICTWIIYIFDRLLDNLKTPLPSGEGLGATVATEVSKRHQFHFKNQYYLQILIIVLSFIAFSLLFFLPKPIIYFGIGLSVFLVFYFFILKIVSQKSDYQYFKEIFTAILYSLAVVVIAFSMKKNIGFGEMLLAFNFFLLVHQSIFIFSYFEFLEKPTTKNFVGKVGIKTSKFGIYSITFWMIISLIISQLYFQESYFLKVAWVELLMSVCSVLLIFFEKFFIKNENYRWLGELVFSLPILLIF